MLAKLLVLALLGVGAFGFTWKKEDSDRVKLAFRQTCQLNGAEDKAPQAEASFDAFYSCISDLIDFDTLEGELAEARQNGHLNSFFGKYCNKTQRLKTCVNSLFDGLYPCMSPAVRGDLENSKAAVAGYVDGLCLDDAEKAISFFKEGGADCLRNYDGFGQCVENHRKEEKETDFLNLYPFCHRLLYVTSCVVEALETCPNRIPSELGKAFYYQLKNNTPCKDEKH